MHARSLLVFLISTFAACAGAGSAVTPSKLVGQPAPDFSLPTLEGRQVALSSLHGKVVVLDIWACWCKSCRKELPRLDELAARHKTDGVAVVAVSTDQERSEVERMIASRPSWTMTVLHDPSGKIADNYVADDLPLVYVIDREGRIRYRGTVSDQEHMHRLEREVTALLQ